MKPCRNHWCVALATKGDLCAACKDDRPAVRTHRSKSDRAASTARLVRRLRDHGLYDIVFRNAGVACIFYEGAGVNVGDDDAWKNDLKLYAYHDSLEKAVRAECRRLGLLS